MVRISVVIPALNEEKYIMHALDGLKHQSFKDFEVIVADGGSTDKTRSIAKKYARVVVERKKGIAIGRNAGARVARGKILVFLDADTKPSRNLLKTYSNAFNDGIIAATGPILPLEKVSKRVNIGYGVVSIFLVKLGIALGHPSIVGSNFAVKREIFEKVKGFDPNLKTYEDWDLTNKLNRHGKIAYLDDALVHTSARRILAWGVFGYFIFYIENVLRYYTIKRPRSDYPEIR